MDLAERLFKGDGSRAWLYGAAMHGDTPPGKAGAGIAGDSDVVHFFEFRTRLIKTELDGACGQAGGVLYAIEPLFFHGSDKFAIH